MKKKPRPACMRCGKEVPRYHVIEAFSDCLRKPIKECFRYVYEVEDEEGKNPPIGAECAHHWDDDVAAWNKKPKAEQLADARFVLRWAPEIADDIRLLGIPHMIDALRIAKHNQSKITEMLAAHPAQEMKTADRKAMRSALKEIADEGTKH
jgi:hypothetical protein